LASFLLYSSNTKESIIQEGIVADAVVCAEEEDGELTMVGVVAASL
jgi:hypothetical protein